MKIAFLLTQLEAGGAQTRVFQTAHELRARGHTVDVYFFYTKRDSFFDEEKQILSLRRGGRSLIDAIPRLMAQLKQGRYDVFISNTAPANIFGNTVAFFAGIGVRAAWQTQPPQRLPLSYRVLDLIAGCLPIYQTNIANSDWNRACFDNYPEIYKRKIRIIKDGIASRNLGISKDAARSEIGLPPDRFIFSTVGRLSAQKGQDTVIKALRDVPGSLLLIIGSGELEAELRELATSTGVQDRVRFCGEVSGEAVSRHLHASDAFLFPSRWETFGLAVVEACTIGLPVIASDIEVLREVLRDGASAIRFVPAGDPPLWASAMRELASMAPDELNKLGAASMIAADAHSISKHVDSIESVISSRSW